MAVQYINGQLYDVWDGGMAGVNTVGKYQLHPGIGSGYANPIGAYGAQPPAPASQPINNNPFASASSGGVAGTLQPYVNRMTQNANQALYGGLLGYQPQSIVAGDAGGTPVNSTPPQWRLPSAIPTPNQGQVGLLGPQANSQQQMGLFGNRSWMGA